MPEPDKHSRTEPPTPKRKKEARKEGRVARSPDLAGWAAIAAGAFLLPWYLGVGERNILGILAQATHVGRHPTTQGALAVLDAGLKTVLVTVGPLGAIFALLAIVANLAQTGRSFSLAVAKPKLSHVSPKAGIKKIVSPQNGVELLKQVVKLTLLVGVGYQALDGLTHELVGSRPVSLLPLLHATGASILSFVRVLALLGILVGFADFLYQRHSLKESLKMTKQEVKEEMRQSEGDPHVKGEIKSRMYRQLRQKAVAGVRRADVVITNPTHYAVALQYDQGRSAAPRVVAKGADLLAQRIRDEAAACEVPVVEDPPLARYLYAVCGVDDPIPAEIYVAVARLLAFVYSLPATVRAVGVHRAGASIVPSEPAALAGLREHQRERIRAVLAGTGGR